MRKEYVHTEELIEAVEIADYAVAVVKVGKGYWCYESWDDYHSDTIQTRIIGNVDYPEYELH